MRALVFALADRGEGRRSRCELGQLLGNERPRRHTAKCTTRNAQQPTVAEQFTWLCHREAMICVEDRCGVGGLATDDTGLQREPTLTRGLPMPVRRTRCHAMCMTVETVRSM